MCRCIFPACQPEHASPGTCLVCLGSGKCVFRVECVLCVVLSVHERGPRSPATCRLVFPFDRTRQAAVLYISVGFVSCRMGAAPAASGQFFLASYQGACCRHRGLLCAFCVSCCLACRLARLSGKHHQRHWQQHRGALHLGCLWVRWFDRATRRSSVTVRTKGAVVVVHFGV